MTRPELPRPILEGRVIAIARRLDPATVPQVAAALREGGVRVLEITLDGEGAVEAIASIAGGETLVGAGTVMDTDAAARAVEAGARFLVSPHTDPDLVRWAASRSIPVIPGAFTPTEAVIGWRAGASAIKVFPAGGPDHLRHLRGPLSDIPFIPSGGVEVSTAPAYLAAGAVAVGVGGWLTGSGDAGVVAARARQLVAACRA